MTISTTTNTIAYDGVAAATTFAYNFIVQQKEQMQVQVAGSLIGQGDFTMTGLGNAGGGNVILNTPLVADSRVVLTRVVEPTQEVDYQPFDSFPAETHESALDKLTMITQQLQEEVDRSLKVGPGETGYDLGIPVPGMLIQYKAGGQESSGRTVASLDPATDFTSRLVGFETNGKYGTYTGDLNDLGLGVARNSTHYVAPGSVTNGPAGWLLGAGFISTDFRGDSLIVMQSLTGVSDAGNNRLWSRRFMSGAWNDWVEFGGASEVDNFPQRLAGYEINSRHLNYTSDLNVIAVNSTVNIVNTAVTNHPADFVGWGFLHTYVYHENNTSATQMLYGMTTGQSANKIWMRNKVSDTWTAWTLVVDGLIANKINRAGDTMVGPLKGPDPAALTDYANRRYVLTNPTMVRTGARLDITGVGVA